MAGKPLNPEELAELRKSPYISSATPQQIFYTEEFQRIAYGHLMDGMTMREIFERYGIDPEVLGPTRIRGFASCLRKKANREGGFADLRAQNRRMPPKGTEEQTLKATVERLEHELAYTRQEVEFLKKIHLADLEARKQWESKQRQK